MGRIRPISEIFLRNSCYLAESAWIFFNGSKLSKSYSYLSASENELIFLSEQHFPHILLFVPDAYCESY